MDYQYLAAFDRHRSLDFSPVTGTAGIRVSVSSLPASQFEPATLRVVGNREFLSFFSFNGFEAVGGHGLGHDSSWISAGLPVWNARFTGR
ncbi:hypothetical protein [Amycolatopsis keratiniphila]|uniref:hypothetical protein n=1 Tax=Amycolatopsis keratiniphila TaxID=129921 RepID=UPI001E58D093|nr:hypothetical protein [Amycolatopsis keratiniphila]